MRPAVATLVLVAGLLVSSACAGDTGSASQESLGTIRGSVLVAPKCPVQSIEDPCPGRPLSGIEVRAVGPNGTVRATAMSRSDGQFAMSVAPGSYTLTATLEDEPGRFVKPMPVQVSAGEVVRADVVVDSGIR